jgi:ATP-binding cassette subfamily F protein 3
VVSHDRHLLRNTVDEFWLIDSGRVEPFNGDLTDYQRWLSEARAADGAAPKNRVVEEKRVEKVDKKELRQSAAAERERLKPFTQALRLLEQRMERLQGQRTRLESELADPVLYEGNNPRLQTLLKEQAALRQELAGLEDEWLEKSAVLEQMQNTQP